MYNFQKESPFNEIFNIYFHHNFISKPFSEFLLGLKNDPDIRITEYIKKSDTKLFEFKGFFQKNDPALQYIITDSTEIKLLEAAVLLNDSLQVYDTIFIYQAVFSASTKEEKGNNFIKEYKRFIRRYIDLFYTSKEKNINVDNNIIGKLTEFYFYAGKMPSLYVFWAEQLKEEKLIFAVSFYIKRVQNITYLYF
jgi:hypothetical protein